MNKTTYDELQAQVEVLQDAAIKICLRLDSDGVSTYGIADDVEALQEVVNKTPAACLAQVKADAVNDFIQFMHSSSDCQLCEKSLNAASAYAERIRQEVA